MRRASAVVGMPILVALLLVVASAKGNAAGPDPANAEAPPPPAYELHDDGLRKSETLSSHLSQLFRLDVVGRMAGRPVTPGTVLPPILEGMKRSSSLRLDDSGRVQVYVTTGGSPEAVLPDLTRIGLQVERVDTDTRTIQGFLPVASLELAADVPGVELVREPDYPVLNTGSVTTEGDALLRTDQLRAKLNVDGAGVRVGVISDGVFGLAQAQSTGDLPTVVNTTTCNVAGEDPSAPVAGAEGTAMLEIVHDLAPGAELWFGYFGAGTGTHGTSLDFMAAVNCLASYADVVVDDISFYNNGPYDGTSAVSQNAANALNNPANPIRGYYTSVGNDAKRHYKETYGASGTTVNGATAGDTWMLHRWLATANTVEWGGALPCPGGPSDVRCGAALVVPSGGVAVINLSWDDPWGASTNDFDLFLLDGATGALYLASANRQAAAGANPTESFAFQNPHATTTNFYLMIGNYKNLATPRALNVFVRCAACVPFTNGHTLSFNTASSSVPNNADASAGVLSLGASGMSSNQTGINAMSYSSRGPTADGRMKPDAIATDGVVVSGAGGFPTAFSGTSAAGVHAAGVAALLLSCNPALHASAGNDPAESRTTLRDALLSTAINATWPPVWPDHTMGHGLLDAGTATAPSLCAPSISTVAEIERPQALAVDSLGRVYIASNATCQVSRLTGTQLEPYAGIAPVGGNHCPFSGEGGSALSARFMPSSLAVDSTDRLIIGDNTNCRVYRVDAGVLTTIAGTGGGAFAGGCAASPDGPAGSTGIWPAGLAASADGTIYVSDAATCKIRTLRNGMIQSIAGNGTCRYTADGPAVFVGFPPGGLAIGRDGAIFVADYRDCRVHKIAAGYLTSIVGRGLLPGASYCARPATDGDGSLATEVYFSGPGGLALDQDENLVIADVNHCTIRKVIQGRLTTPAGVVPPWGVACYSTGDGGPATDAHLGSPVPIAIDGKGNLYIADTSGNKVRMVPALDRDRDLVVDHEDNCAFRPNASQLNTDGAALTSAGLPTDTTIAASFGDGDVCDADDATDGFGDAEEAAGCNGSGPLDPLLADTDGDRTRDGAECAMGTNPGNGASKPPVLPVGDTDSDGLSDAVEAILGSNPGVSDTDGDGISDGIEYRGYGTSPLVADSDGDGCPDDTEIASVNGDYVVNASDLMLIAINFFSATKSQVDVNKDGIVNAIDLSLAAQNFKAAPCGP